MPRHVAIIMDGNGRWATKRFLPRVAGHVKGADAVRGIVEHKDEGAGSAAANGTQQAMRIVTMVLQFAERNPGMVKVMVGDALVFENERLQQRMNLFFDKVEAALRQCLREGAETAGSSTPTADAQQRAALLGDLMRGRMLRFVRSGFKAAPDADIQNVLALLH